MNAIVNVYGDIRDHTMNFKKKIFPAIVGLASSLYAYSNRAIVSERIFPTNTSPNRCLDIL